MNNDQHSISHGPSLIEKIWSSVVSEELFWCLPPLVAPLSCSSLLPVYSRFSPPDWGFQGMYLSNPLLPPVIGNSGKDREVWLCQAQGTEYSNGCLPLYAFVLSVVFLHFRTFPALWNGLEFCH